MRKLYFLLPGITGKFGGGGLWAELKTVKLASKICEVEIVTYRQKESDWVERDNRIKTKFLADIIEKENFKDCIFVVSWGFDVPKLIKKLSQHNIIYHAHSSGYGFSLPSNIPIITVSRNTMGYWGNKSPNSLIYYLPNQIGQEFFDRDLKRDIDVLVQTRKSSQYLLTQLIPALQSSYKVKIIDRYVEDLATLFNRSKIYLYDSAEYWRINGVSEGFGLPPLEAMACGCQIFSSVNHALADYLDPGFNCHKISNYCLEYDLEKIQSTITNNNYSPLPKSFWETYSEEYLLKRLQIILQEIDRFFDLSQDKRSIIPDLNFFRLSKLWLKLKITKAIDKI